MTINYQQILFTGQLYYYGLHLAMKKSNENNQWNQSKGKIDFCIQMDLNSITVFEWNILFHQESRFCQKWFKCPETVTMAQYQPSKFKMTILRQNFNSQLAYMYECTNIDFFILEYVIASLVVSIWSLWFCTHEYYYNNNTPGLLIVADP